MVVMNTYARNLPEASSDSRTRITTLLVDDSPFMLKILAQILEEAGNFDQTSEHVGETPPWL